MIQKTKIGRFTKNTFQHFESILYNNFEFYFFVLIFILSEKVSTNELTKNDAT